MKEITIYVELLNDGCPVARPTQALDLGNGFFKILPTPNYDTAEEEWGFPPGSIVKGEKKQGINGEFTLAVLNE